MKTGLYFTFTLALLVILKKHIDGEIKLNVFDSPIILKYKHRPTKPFGLVLDPG